jgi:hypothetical protein
MNPAFLHQLNQVCTADYAVMINTGKTPFPYPGFKPDAPQPDQLPKVGKFFAPNVWRGSRCQTATYHVAHAIYLKIVAAAKKAGLPASSPCQNVF